MQAATPIAARPNPSQEDPCSPNDSGFARVSCSLAPLLSSCRDGRFVVVRDEGKGATLIGVANWVTELRAMIKGKKRLSVVARADRHVRAEGSARA